MVITCLVTRWVLRAEHRHQFLSVSAGWCGNLRGGPGSVVEKSVTTEATFGLLYNVVTSVVSCTEMKVDGE